MLRFVSALHVSTEDSEQIAQDKDILLRRIVFKRFVRFVLNVSSFRHLLQTP